jgi:site-specific recombinase XerD
LPITEQAYGLLGESKQPIDSVFTLIQATNQRDNRFLSKWVLDAGISKKITFHCFRHTFATLQLSMGTDTVSKMLSHKDLNTTQIYATIIDETKRTAYNRIKLEM